MSGVPARVRETLELLGTWTPPGPGQAALRREYLAHLQTHPDALDRAGPPAHLTASCLVLDADATSVLLVLHRKAHRWFQPGGHLESGDEGLRAGAAREAFEETGIDGLALTSDPVDLDRHRLAEAFGRCTEHLDVRFAAVAPPGARPVCSPESLDARWWPVEALPSDEPSLLRLVAAGVAATRGR